MRWPWINECKEVIYCFERVSGLQKNLAKSCLLEINLNDDEVKEFAGMMRCSIQYWPLGHPLGGETQVYGFLGAIGLNVSKIDLQLETRLFIFER